MENPSAHPLKPRARLLTGLRWLFVSSSLFVIPLSSTYFLAAWITVGHRPIGNSPDPSSLSYHTPFMIALLATVLIAFIAHLYLLRLTARKAFRKRPGSIWREWLVLVAADTLVVSFAAFNWFGIAGWVTD